MATETLRIQITSKGAVTVKRDLLAIGKSSLDASKSVNKLKQSVVSLKKALTGLGGATIKNNINAIVIKDYTDVNAFTNAIIKLLDDEQYYNMLRVNALKEVKKNHLKKNVSETWREIFKRLGIY